MNGCMLQELAIADVLLHAIFLSEVVMDAVLLLLSGGASRVADRETKGGGELLHEPRDQSPLAHTRGTADDYGLQAVAFHPLAPGDHFNPKLLPLFFNERRVELPGKLCKKIQDNQ